MTDSPLYVSFLWHMHQPYYKDPFTGYYKLPWVRLHGTKDYLDMALALESFPDVKQTFNLVPSLLEQLDDYANDTAKDLFLELSRRQANLLTDEDKAFIIENFFLANWDTMIKPFPRYFELLNKRGLRFSRGDAPSVIRYFSEQDFLDLQVFFNLTWIDPFFREHDSVIREIVKKGAGFNEEDKYAVLDKHLELLKQIVPTYKRMQDKGQIELSTTPFYHPILPLLCDTDSARMAMPGAKLPKRRFMHPEDARMQIDLGMDYFKKTFGMTPNGMWPSEGSVSEEAMGIISEFGLKWVATDEEILGASIGKVLRNGSGHIDDPTTLYRTYKYKGVSMFFRDHGLSDLLGFVYSGWPPDKAAKDLINNLLNIRNTLPSKQKFVVPIILDGENAWEYYKNDGRDFLLYLYEGLSKEERLKTTTMSGYLAEAPEEPELHRLHAGSWIYSSFGTWIGHEEDNLSWDYLDETRNSLSATEIANPDKPLKEAWKSLFIAEGSDWNWWYGDDHVSETQKEFDELYRANLMNVYKQSGLEIPQWLYVPVLRGDKVVEPKTTLRGFITPKIDGLISGYYEWYNAACMDVGKSGGSMHKAESHLLEIRYGFNLDEFYLRIDPKAQFKNFPNDSKIILNFLKPDNLRLVITLSEHVEVSLFRMIDGEWKEISCGAEAAVGDILEARVPFKCIGANPGDEINFFVTLNKDSMEMERCPWRGFIAFTVPTKDFEAMMWY